MNRRVNRPGFGFTIQWLTIRSRDGGATWETLDEYQHPSYASSGLPRDVAVDSNGNIYVVAMASEEPFSWPEIGDRHWLIRKGLATSGGMVWSTVGDFSYPLANDYDHDSSDDGPTGVACVGANVFVVGGALNTWTVRRSSNGGSTWQVVDSFRFFKNGISAAWDVAGDSAGNVYVSGYSYKQGSQLFVRRSTNGGTKWSTVDQFKLPGGSYAEGSGITVDANDNVHVIGMASTTQINWVARQRSAATGTWSTTDLFSLADGHTTWGTSITADPAGNLFGAGYGYDLDGVRHGWLVRRKLAP
jgi:hypothetical protein